MANTNMHTAKKIKNDEFYTRLTDIEKEMLHYRNQLHGKIIYCNCDDPEESNFWKYFYLNFEFLGLKKLISTHYNETQPTYKLEYDGNNITETKLQENGDFRNDESIRLLKEADVVITNPPFSLFREYVNQLMEYDKKFIIIGNMNAITYREIFTLLKNDKMWLGNRVGAFEFEVPNNLERNNTYMKDGHRYAKFGNIAWYTNLDVNIRHEKLILYKEYNNNEYPTYENHHAINIDKVKDIPKNYNEAMGVPITFLTKYNPDQFSIIGLGISNSGLEVGVKPYTQEHKEYRKNIQKRGAVDGDLYMVIDGEVKVPYARILIERKVTTNAN